MFYILYLVFNSQANLFYIHFNNFTYINKYIICFISKLNHVKYISSR